jgi:hypothetical protein
MGGNEATVSDGELSMQAKLALVAAVLLVSAGAAMAQDPPKSLPAQDGGQVDVHVVPQDQNNLLRYWTAERLRNAKPMPLPKVDPKNFK